MANGPGVIYFPIAGFQKITMGSGVVTLTPPAGATFAVIGVEADIVRYRDDGTPPDATTGVQVMPNTALPYQGPLTAIQLISPNGTGILQVAYYGNKASS